jgi:hypothetical protein
MIRRIFKIIGWIAGSTLGLGVSLYLIAVAINWRDRAPSAAAVHFTNLYRDRPTVADEDNAFIYVMGFDVAPEESPRQLGMKRIAWMQDSSPAANVNARRDPRYKRFDYKEKRLPAVREFVDVCRRASRGCTSAFIADDGLLEQ